jgi:uroporphyrinogen-III decarboxylase
MNNSSWDDLIKLIEGKKLNYQPTGFIIDSPWLPGWYGISTIDYYTSDKLWLKANLKAIETFPDTWFLPGFWSEYGMCTEPSAFGTRMVFPEHEFPHAEKISSFDVNELPQPNVKTDGLLPFMIKRLKNNEKAIRDAGHRIRFAVARGPFNIASFIMGTTEFMMALALDSEGIKKMLDKITVFICDWLSWQRECFDSIDGVLLLDDIIGFVGEKEFQEFVIPYIKEIFKVTGTKVRFLHNDADGLITATYLGEMGVNMFNFSFKHTMKEIRDLAGPDIILVGNIPPRDIMASATPDQVEDAVLKALGEINIHDNIIWSTGGGMAPDTRDENINAFITTVRNNS